MPIPAPEMKAWLSVFADQMPSTPAPWFGVNISDVNEDNLAAYQDAVGVVTARLIRLPGLSLHFNAMSDYGQRKRLLSIVRYGETIDPGLYARLFDNDEYCEEWLAMGATLESYQWFLTNELTA